MQETQAMWVWSLDWEDPLLKEMATRSSIFAWKIPWTEEPGGLSSIGSQRVRHWAHMNTGFKAESRVRSQELPLQHSHPPRIVALRDWEIPTSSYLISWHWQNQWALPAELSSAPENVQSFFSSTVLIPKDSCAHEEHIIWEHIGASFISNGPLSTPGKDLSPNSVKRQRPSHFFLYNCLSAQDFCLFVCFVFIFCLYFLGIHGIMRL